LENLVGAKPSKLRLLAAEGRAAAIKLGAGRRREYIDEQLLPLHPITLQTAYLAGQIEGQ
jgi:hypothetical protein